MQTEELIIENDTSGIIKDQNEFPPFDQGVHREDRGPHQTRPAPRVSQARQHLGFPHEGPVCVRGTITLLQEYETESEAKKAVVELDGRCLNGQRIIAEFAKPKSSPLGYQRLR